MLLLFVGTFVVFLLVFPFVFVCCYCFFLSFDSFVFVFPLMYLVVYFDVVDDLELFF